MPDEPTPDIQIQLQQLRDSFSAAIPEKMAEIEDLWERLNHENSGTEAQVLHRLAHSLAGNAGTFGFLDLGESARKLEEMLVDDLPSGHLAVAMEKLRESALRAERYSPQQESTFTFPVLRDFDAGPLVLVVEDDDFFAKELVLQLEGYGYRTAHCRLLKDLAGFLEQERPAALIMDIVHPDGGLAGPGILLDFAQRGLALPPVLFISVRDDISARLEAVRAGGLGYFTKPLEMGQLITRLEVLVGFKGPLPFRILMIEDSDTESTHYAHVLRKAGMKVEVVSDPLKVMNPLVAERPDLILMDLYMPGCTGLELAAVIRQQDAYMGIPIVFLSSEMDTDRQLRGLSLGGDDFLEKPISPEHLVASLTARVTRARMLRSNMSRDSLTGLLNHANFKYQLKLEVSRAARRQGRLALAVMDIDHFRGINDAYGHPVGDRVIRGLTRHLQQKLRETDIIGRLGGDEFGVIFLDTDEEGAIGRLDNIRETFAAHHYRGLDEVSPSTQIATTFSCGVSGFPGVANVGADPEALLQVADQALLQAKRLGRNRVVIAGRG